MKKLAFLTPLLLVLVGCEQTKPPTPEGRKLIQARTATGTHWTKLEVRPQPATPRAGEVSIWDLKVFRKKDKEDGTRKEWKFFNQLPNIHSSRATSAVLMNAWVISRDGSVFLRSRPVYKAYGSFVTDWIIPKAGTYDLFVEYQPIQKDTLSEQTKVFPLELARKEIKVTGQPELPESMNWNVVGTGNFNLPVFNSLGEKSNYRVQVDVVPLRARTRQTLRWAPTVGQGVFSNTSYKETSRGQGASALPIVETYVVALSDKGTFTHYRGQDAVAIFAEPGFHKLWFCFGQGGQKYFATLDVNVLPRAIQTRP